MAQKLPLKWTGYPDLPEAGNCQSLCRRDALMLQDGDLATEQLIAMAAQPPL